MKRFTLEFCKRGLLAAAGGPMVLAIIYGILGAAGAAEALAPGQVCLGILTVTLMAFIAAGTTSIYTLEQLPLPCAILIHAGVLYLDYLLMYLLNNWIPRNAAAIGIFTAVFAAGFALIWLIIYLSIQKKTEQLNRQLPGYRP